MNAVGSGGQDAVVAWLASGDAFAGLRGPVERIDTHGAIVFLAGDTALKLKRAVRYSYLDFSTPARRIAALERELEVNREEAPQIYERVHRITRSAAGRLALDGEGEVVDAVLRMRRFPEADVLARRAESGALPASLAEPLAERIARYHARARIVTEGGGAVRLARLARNLGRDIAAAGAAGVEARALEAAVAARIDAIRPLLESRRAGGFVRRCHGDLHLANIVLLGATPVLFDAIEFSEEIATVDVLHDLAFLLMDLVVRGRPDFANRVLNRYLVAAGSAETYDGLAALPVFLALRAGVRALVESQRAALAEGEERAAGHGRALDYLHAAGAFLAHHPVRLVAVGGFSGTGKSTLAAALAPALGAPPGAVHLRSDVERKVLAGIPPEMALPRESYTAEASRRVYDILAGKARRVLGAGHSVIVDAVFAREEERVAIASVAAECGAAFDGLWLTAPEAELARRIAGRTGDASDADAMVMSAQVRRGAGHVAWSGIGAAGGPAETEARARALLDLAGQGSDANA